MSKTTIARTTKRAKATRKRRARFPGLDESVMWRVLAERTKEIHDDVVKATLAVGVHHHAEYARGWREMGSYVADVLASASAAAWRRAETLQP